MQDGHRQEPGGDHTQGQDHAGLPEQPDVQGLEQGTVAQHTQREGAEPGQAGARTAGPISKSSDAGQEAERFVAGDGRTVGRACLHPTGEEPVEVALEVQVAELPQVQVEVEESAEASVVNVRICFTIISKIILQNY